MVIKILAAFGALCLVFALVLTGHELWCYWWRDRRWRWRGHE